MSIAISDFETDHRLHDHHYRGPPIVNRRPDTEQSETKAATDAAERERYWYGTRPRCPKCGHHWLRTIRTVEKSDDCYCLLKRCNQCKHTFTAIFE